MKSASKILADLCELIVDCEHKTALTQDTGYPSIRTPNIGKGRLILEGVNRVSEEIYKIWTQRAIPQAGDLILAREAPVGNVAIIPHNLKVCLGQRTVLIRPNKKLIDPHYLVYLLLGPEIQGNIQSLSNGSIVHHLNMTDIRNLTLPRLPQISTQRKIASILSAYDDLIENNTRRIAILEEIAQSLYREWFVHFRFPGHEKKSMVSSALGMIPEGWKVVKLADISDINMSNIKRGYEPLSINYIDINSVSIGQIDNIQTLSFATAPSRARRIVKHGDIIWSTVRPNRRSYCLILIPIPYLIVSTGFAVISAKHVPYTYLYQTLITDVFVKYLTNRATGSAYPAVSSSDFQEALILLPPNSVLDTFHEITNEYMHHKHNLQEKNTNLRHTRDLLLPKLISGELDVETLDIATSEEDIVPATEIEEQEQHEEIVPIHAQEMTLW